MQVVTSINCFYDAAFRAPVEEQITRLYDAGFRALDMNFWDWCHDPQSPFVAEGWQDWMGRIADTAARLNIKFVQAHAHVYNFYREPDALDKYELLRRSLEGAAMLNIPWVVFHPSRMPEMSEDETIKGNVEYFKPFVKLAEELHTGIALENMSREHHGFIYGRQLARLIDELDSPAVGACWDTGHAHLAGVNQTENLRALGGRLKALHVQDSDGRTDQHTAPFFGTIDWDEMMGALKEIGYPGPFTFEAHNIVRRVPESCRATAAKLLYEIGVALAGDR